MHLTDTPTKKITYFHLPLKKNKLSKHLVFLPKHTFGVVRQVEIINLLTEILTF